MIPNLGSVTNFSNYMVHFYKKLQIKKNYLNFPIAFFWATLNCFEVHSVENQEIHFLWKKFVKLFCNFFSTNRMNIALKKCARLIHICNFHNVEKRKW